MIGLAIGECRFGIGVAEWGVRRGEKPRRAQRRREEGLGIYDCGLEIGDFGVWSEMLTGEAESTEKKWQERS